MPSKPSKEKPAKSPKPAPDERFAKTIVALATALGRPRQTVHRWMREPDAPKPRSDGRHDIAAWREFASVRDAEASTPAPSEKRLLEERNLRAQAEERELRVQQKRGQLVDRAQYDAEVAALVGEAVTVLRAEFEDQLPAQLAGRAHSESELRRAFSRSIDKVCLRLSRGISPDEQPRQVSPANASEESP